MCKMLSNKKINEIRDLLFKIREVENIDKFYELATKLYYKINNFVFLFEEKMKGIDDNV